MTDASLRLRCACGWEATGSEDELLAAAIAHGERVHNMRPSREEVLAMVVSEPAAPRPSRPDE